MIAALTLHLYIYKWIRYSLSAPDHRTLSKVVPQALKMCDFLCLPTRSCHQELGNEGSHVFGWRLLRWEVSPCYRSHRVYGQSLGRETSPFLPRCESHLRLCAAQSWTFHTNSSREYAEMQGKEIQRWGKKTGSSW